MAATTGDVQRAAPPEHEEEPLACNRCGEGFLRAPHLVLHVARRHPGPLTPEERAAFEAALREEEAWLQEFRVRMRGWLAALGPSTVTLLVVLLLYVGGAPVEMGLLLIPPGIGFSWLAYLFTVRGEM